MNQMMGSMFNDPFFRGAGIQPSHGQRQTGRNAPVIEEVHDDELGSRAGRAGSEPIVEEPDDEDPHSYRAHQRQRRASPTKGINSSRSNVPTANNAQLSAFPFGMGGFPDLSAMTNVPGGASYCFTSSSYTAAGPNGVSYQKTTTSRRGPGGVHETQSTVRDGRTGTQAIRISRGLGDKERTITRMRDANGREMHHDDLKGIQHDEADRFDQHWRETAEQQLLGGPRMLGQGSGYQQQQQRYALPSSTTTRQPQGIPASRGDMTPTQGCITLMGAPAVVAAPGSELQGHAIHHMVQS
eukprot:CAMPEP_0202902362 /NCGR_PEP_ID=MMETSP1392-20130828/16808_1 /ASSEMBLY_ACC=CAM_ASM_000868 /TAXON_ID=225041 /ORGANISM="Chlamydomonas chlamydogama, Strain SAG 11-48b" /LENGTH=296 /DNA_ID=CAMNT_0049589115 /DNA_START=171 /DNA_END=1062 /DNA_ORIENTATION=+